MIQKQAEFRSPYRGMAELLFGKTSYALRRQLFKRPEKTRKNQSAAAGFAG
jgi:hypothetical protein